MNLKKAAAAFCLLAPLVYMFALALAKLQALQGC